MRNVLSCAVVVAVTGVESVSRGPKHATSLYTYDVIFLFFLFSSLLTRTPGARSLVCFIMSKCRRYSRYMQVAVGRGIYNFRLTSRHAKIMTDFLLQYPSILTSDKSWGNMAWIGGMVRRLIIP